MKTKTSIYSLLLLGLAGLAATAAPVVTITAPTNGAVLTAPASFTLRASVSGGGNAVTQIEFFNGTNSLGVDTDNPYRIDVDNLAAGQYVLSAVLTDTMGGTSTNSVAVIVNALPTISITNPANGAGLIAPATFTLQATASDSDGSIAQIQFYRGTTAIGLATTNPASITVKGLGAGNYTFRAAATDNLGGRTTTQIGLVVKSRPAITFTAPAAMARLTNTSTLITGTASDPYDVALVEYSLNSASFVAATGTNNWNTLLTLAPGTNTVRVRATDIFGNFSLTNSRSFFQVVTDALSLTVTGTGTVSGPTNGQILEIGRGYQLTATPGVGSVFSNWTGTASGNAATLGFLMQSNMALQANFVPNPFARVGGTYYGLFYETNGTRHGASGDFMLRLTTRGKYTAALRLAGRRYRASGNLNLEGTTTNVILRIGTNALTVVWAVDLHGLDQVTGSVSDGQWLASLLGDRALFHASTNPAPLAARYTLVVPGSLAAPAEPDGHGWGTFRVSPGGSAVMAGALAEGTRFTRKAPLSKNGAWPLYVPLYQLQGSILGWIQFDTNAASDDFTGLVDWSKPALPAAVRYPAGFTNQPLLTGSRYLPPSNSTHRVLALTNGVLVLLGGNLSQTCTNDIVLGANNRVTNASPNKLSLTLTTGTGLFKGSFTDSNAAGTVTFSGALLQKSIRGAGYFLGTNLSGAALIQAP